MQKVILIIDDDPVIQKFFKVFFKNFPDILQTPPELMGCESVDQARDLMKGKTFDWIFLDAQIPDSWFFLEESLNQNPQRRFFVTSSKNSTREAVKALKKGACDYIVKPFSIEELKQTLPAEGAKPPAEKPFSVTEAFVRRKGAKPPAEGVASPSRSMSPSEILSPPFEASSPLFEASSPPRKRGASEGAFIKTRSVDSRFRGSWKPPNVASNDACGNDAASGNDKSLLKTAIPEEGTGADRTALPAFPSTEGFAKENLPPSVATCPPGKGMRKLYGDLWKIRSSPVSVLITGESGVGKEVLARTLYEMSFPKKTQPFVAVNCGAIPSGLMESEMFGHKKGAFTGAGSDRQGFFEMAHGGILFLDEIGELPLPLQPKLLRVLQEKVVRRVGDVVDRPVNVRLVSATNRNLEKMVRDKKFREDLFYRLNVVCLHVPPLRERKEDIPDLIRHFFKKQSPSRFGQKKPPELSEAVLNVFLEHNYPGNIRELENVVERISVLGQTGPLKPEEVQSFFEKPPVPSPLNGSFNRANGKGVLTGLLPRQGMNLEQEIQNLEKSFILQALQREEGRKWRASALLGLSGRSFRYKVKKYGIQFKENKNSGDGGEG